MPAARFAATTSDGHGRRSTTYPQPLKGSLLQMTTPQPPVFCDVGCQELTPSDSQRVPELVPLLLMPHGETSAAQLREFTAPQHVVPSNAEPLSTSTSKLAVTSSNKTSSVQPIYVPGKALFSISSHTGANKTSWNEIQQKRLGTPRAATCRPSDTRPGSQWTPAKFQPQALPAPAATTEERLPAIFCSGQSPCGDAISV